MNTQILKLEDNISKIATIEGKTVHFDYKQYKEFSDEEDLFSVHAYTFNSISGETFLLKASIAKHSYEDALSEILDYVINSKVTARSYTVQWYKLNNGRLGDCNTSYFYCKNALEVVEKFYHNKHIDDYVIYEMKLNPIA